MEPYFRYGSERTRSVISAFSACKFSVSKSPPLITVIPVPPRVRLLPEIGLILPIVRSDIDAAAETRLSAITSSALTVN